MSRLSRFASIAADSIKMTGSTPFTLEAAQGGVTSSLLANVYLDPLDWLMADLVLKWLRYADDMVVLCHTAEEAEAALKELREWMAGAGLTLHPDKTRTVDMNLADCHFDFLGFRFQRSRRGRMMRLVRPKSLRKLRESIKPRTRRNNGKCMEVIVAALNRTLPDWFGYFKKLGFFWRLDSRETEFASLRNGTNH